MTFALGAAVSLFLLGVGAVQLFLYSLRWYEISNRVYDSEMTWFKALRDSRFKPVRVFFRECFYAVIYISCYPPAFAARLLRREHMEFEPGELVKGKPLIILIHGLFGLPAHFWIMRRRFAARSIPNALVFEYNSFKGSPADNCARLRDFLLRVKAKTGMSEVILIGHSLGGLIAHEYAREYGNSGDVKAVVALGTPFRGTRLTALAIMKKARGLHPSNPLFAEITTAKLNADFLSLYSRYDQFILPYTNSEHPGADENREIDICGHTGFFFNKKVFKIILEWITRENPPEPAMAGASKNSGPAK